ncbi:MAG: hypothetical protein J0H15_01070 [Xanthomonadales bacterium]|nr:hypothetical protein [Xanthomonadales bacterium]
MQQPERRYIGTTTDLWRKFRDELEPADLVFEYANDESWKGVAFNHGGLAAFRGGCTIKIVQIWIT